MAAAEGGWVERKEKRKKEKKRKINRLTTLSLWSISNFNHVPKRGSSPEEISGA
jgi:hypothetical protein